jgi:uncharacterized membrane protein YhaH (DUF805 family)
MNTLTAPPRPLLDDVDAHPWRVLFSLRGRVNRRTWWWYGVALPVGLGLLAHALLGIAGTAAKTAEALVNLALLWPAIAVSAKRWQDRGLSPWWVLVALVPAAGWLVALVFNGLLPGTPGPNRHGALPGTPGFDALGLPLAHTGAAPAVVNSVR